MLQQRKGWHCFRCLPCLPRWQARKRRAKEPEIFTQTFMSGVNLKPNPPCLPPHTEEVEVFFVTLRNHRKVSLHKASYFLPRYLLQSPIETTKVTKHFVVFPYTSSHALKEKVLRVLIHISRGSVFRGDPNSQRTSPFGMIGGCGGCLGFLVDNSDVIIR